MPVQLQILNQNHSIWYFNIDSLAKPHEESQHNTLYKHHQCEPEHYSHIELTELTTSLLHETTELHQGNYTNY